MKNKQEVSKQMKLNLGLSECHLHGYVSISLFAMIVNCYWIGGNYIESPALFDHWDEIPINEWENQ